MQTIIIKLDLKKLKNMDYDLSFSIPKRIEEISDGTIQDNGFDFLDVQVIPKDNGFDVINDQILGVWLQTESANESYPMIVKLFQEEKFEGNDLSLTAEIYISENESEDIENCNLVFPV